MINTIVLSLMLALTVTLIAKDALAENTLTVPVYELSNCSQKDYQSALSTVENARKLYKDGYTSLWEKSLAEVYYAEVSLCAKKIDKIQACETMMRFQKGISDILDGNKSDTESGKISYSVNNSMVTQLDERRRWIQIQNFCK